MDNPSDVLPGRAVAFSLQLLLVLQLMPLRSHALLQEAGVGLAEIMEEQGFYTKKRTLSAPLKARSKLSFGEAVPIELPTMREHHLDCEG